MIMMQTYLPLRRPSRCYLRFFHETIRETSNCLGVDPTENAGET